MSGGPVAGGLTTHPVPFSIGPRKGSSPNSGVNGPSSANSNGRKNGRGGSNSAIMVGEYEQHPLRQQTSYLPISAVGGAQFVLKPPRQTKAKNTRPKMIAPLLAPAPAKGIVGNGRKRGGKGNLTGMGTAGCVQVNGMSSSSSSLLAVGTTGEGEVRVRVKQEEGVVLEKEREDGLRNGDGDGMEGVVTVVDASTSSRDVILPTYGNDNETGNRNEEGGLIDGMYTEPPTTETTNGGVEVGTVKTGSGSTATILALSSHPPLSPLPTNSSEPNTNPNTNTNTFAAPARPSRKIKKYACDICGQIFTRSGDVKRHKDSRHVEGGGGGVRCPYCDRVLTR